MQLAEIYKRLVRLQMRTGYLRSKDDGELYAKAKDYLQNPPKILFTKEAITPLT